VRRGGRIVVAAGRNQDLVSALDKKQPLLPMTLDKKVEMPPSDNENEREQGIHTLFWKVHPDPFRLVERRVGADDKLAPIEVVRLRPKDASDPALKPDDYRASLTVVAAGKSGPPVIVRGTYGLGQVMLVALDIDQLPLKDVGGIKSVENFWKGLRGEMGTTPERVQEQPQIVSGFQTGMPSADVAARLQQKLEYFEDIPVIGFGWVALFILLYIIVVGPLDYLFLKKVVKRLELTWITFPAVVLIISVAAYFTAYWIKGDKLKINKVDVVDIDLQTDQVYGNTWFALFSPRIDHYTIGIEPAAPGWAPGEPGNTRVLVSWMDRPEEFGYGGARGQGLFRRTYDYEPNATGLRGVPIQVWSTKSFAASWQVPARKQLFSSNLRHPADRPNVLTGTITSHLPVELHDVVVLYEGKRFELPNRGRLVPEVETRLDGLENGSTDFSLWYPQLTQVGFGPRGRGVSEYHDQMEAIVKNILFNRHAMKSHPNSREPQRNSSLRLLDQSWRREHLTTDEVILYGRVPVLNGEAQKIGDDPGSPSRLWLNELRKAGRKWPGLSGTLRQETFVRVFIPVRGE
jgi:hypothetical protein